MIEETTLLLSKVAVIVSIAAVICSAVVPFVSVRFAERLVQRDALRQSARDVFLGINRHMLDYQHVFLECYANRQEAGEVSASAKRDTSELTRTLESQTKLRELLALLSGDIIVLRFLFNDKGKPLGTRIQQLAATSQWLSPDAELPTLDACLADLKKEMDAIAEQMVLLWDSLKK